MNNSSGFGRDIGEFLNSLEKSVFKEGENNGSDVGVFVRTVTQVGNEKFLVRVSVANLSGSEEVEFTVMREHAEAMGVEVGKISEDMLPELEYFSEVAKAYSSACSSFAYTYCSSAMLKKKLLQKGFSREVCDDALVCVKNRGFLNENEIAIRRAQVLAEKHWGRSRIRAKLHEEGYNSSAMTAVSDQLELMDFVTPCAELIRKKYGEIPEDRHERDLMLASLTRMGYSSSDIREAMKLLRDQ